MEMEIIFLPVLFFVLLVISIVLFLKSRKLDRLKGENKSLWGIGTIVSMPVIFLVCFLFDEEGLNVMSVLSDSDEYLIEVIAASLAMSIVFLGALKYAHGKQSKASAAGAVLLGILFLLVKVYFFIWLHLEYHDSDMELVDYIFIINWVLFAILGILLLKNSKSVWFAEKRQRLIGSSVMTLMPVFYFADIMVSDNIYYMSRHTPLEEGQIKFLEIILAFIPMVMGICSIVKLVKFVRGRRAETSDAGTEGQSGAGQEQRVADFIKDHPGLAKTGIVILSVIAGVISSFGRERYNEWLPLIAVFVILDSMRMGYFKKKRTVNTMITAVACVFWIVMLFFAQDYDRLFVYYILGFFMTAGIVCQMLLYAREKQSKVITIETIAVGAGYLLFYLLGIFLSLGMWHGEGMWVLYAFSGDIGSLAAFALFITLLIPQGRIRGVRDAAGARGVFLVRDTAAVREGSAEAQESNGNKAKLLCPNCGGAVAEGKKFCRHCGAALMIDLKEEK